MNRRSLLLTLGILALASSSIAGMFYLLVRYERTWYARAAPPPGELRTQRSQEFYTNFLTLVTDITGEPQWSGEFTDEQINSFFVEKFIEAGFDKRALPEGITQPRVQFEPGKLRFGFRYGRGAWSSVITVDLRVWLPTGEPNVMALELAGLSAGVIPIKAQSILERLAQTARDNGIEVTWYRHNSHPVALLRFQADQPRATMQLQLVNVSQGKLRIQGGSDGANNRVSAPPALPDAKGEAN